VDGGGVGGGNDNVHRYRARTVAMPKQKPGQDENDDDLMNINSPRSEDISKSELEQILPTDGKL